MHEKLSLIEHEMVDLIPKDVSYIKKETLGILDLQIVTLFAAHKAQEEVLGKALIDPEKHKLIYNWVNAVKELPFIKETIPPHETLVAALRNWSA